MTDETPQGACPLNHKDQPDRPRAGVPVICTGHTGEVTAALAGDIVGPARLPKLYAELGAVPVDRALTANVGGWSASGSLANERLVIDTAGSDHRMRVEALLVSWVRLVGEQRGVILPPIGDVVVLCGWLAVHLDWALEQEWAADFADEILGLSRRAYGLLHPRPGAWTPVQVLCGCGGMLHTTLGMGANGDGLDDDGLLPADYECELCQEVYSLVEVIRLAQPDEWMGWDRLALWCATEGHPVVHGTVRRWASEGRVRTRTTAAGVRYSRVDVVDLMAAKAA